jgi:molybdopterin biosynthesis enzyme MoaB
MLPGLVMDDLLNLDTCGTTAMQSHQISGISNHGLITTRKDSPTTYKSGVLSPFGKFRSF